MKNLIIFPILNYSYSYDGMDKMVVFTGEFVLFKHTKSTIEGYINEDSKTFIKIRESRKKEAIIRVLEEVDNLIGGLDKLNDTTTLTHLKKFIEEVILVVRCERLEVDIKESVDTYLKEDSMCCSPAPIFDEIGRVNYFDINDNIDIIIVNQWLGEVYNLGRMYLKRDIRITKFATQVCSASIGSYSDSDLINVYLRRNGIDANKYIGDAIKDILDYVPEKNNNDLFRLKALLSVIKTPCSVFSKLFILQDYFENKAVDLNYLSEDEKNKLEKNADQTVHIVNWRLLSGISREVDDALDANRKDEVEDLTKEFFAGEVYNDKVVSRLNRILKELNEDDILAILKIIEDKKPPSMCLSDKEDVFSILSLF